MKERKGKRRYLRPKIKRPREFDYSCTFSARKAIDRFFPALPPSCSPSLLEQRTRVTPENEFCSSLDGGPYWFRAASGELLQAGKVARKNCQTAGAGYFSSTAVYILKYTYPVRDSLLFIYLFIVLDFPERVEIIVRFAAGGTAGREHEFG